MNDPFGALCRHGDVHVGPTAKGALSDARFVAKDLFAIAGHRNCAGSPDWLRTHEPARANAPVIDALLDAGAELTSVATMDELAYSVAGRNAHYGTPTNPRCPTRIPGGSSSGSAVAVAGGLCDFAIGTDTTGSVRTPAALCGIAGIRTSYGNVDTSGVVPLAQSFDTVGAFARDLPTLERVVAVMSRAAHDASVRRALILVDAFEIADPEVRSALAPALGFIRGGVPTGDARIPSGASLFDWAECVRTIQSHDVWQAHGAWITANHPHFGPGVSERFAAAARVTSDERSAAEGRRDAFARVVRDLVGDETILVLPTSPAIAPLRDATDTVLDAWRRRVMALTSVANVSGVPQLSIPVARADGAPVGLSLLGPRGSDVALVRVARTLVPDQTIEPSASTVR